MAQVSRLIVSGSSQFGKSYWAKRYIERARSVLVVDVLQEYRQLTAISGPGLADLADHFSRHRGRGFRLSYQPCMQTRQNDFDMICRWAWEVGSMIFVVEEASWYASAQWIPAEFENLVARGRHRGIELILTAQRPAQVPMLYRENATRLICFRTHEPNSIDYLRSWIRDQALIAELPRLGIGQYLDYDCARGEGRIVKKRLDKQ